MWLSLLFLLAGAPAGAAGTGARAEFVRLDEEMHLLAAKNAWSGIERTYVQMVELESKGLQVTWEHHRLGALAAQARGNVMDTWRRLRAAEAVESHEETLVWLATLEATHGRVIIELSPLVFGEVPIEPLDRFADPGATRVVTAATASLTEHRHFDGLLPLGRYRVGGVPFDIDGGPMIQVAVEPGQPRGAAATAKVGELTLVATRAPSSPAEFERAAAAITEVVSGIRGVASVVVVPPPGLRFYGEFGDGTLEALGLTSDAVAQQVAAELALAVGRVAVTPNAISVASSDVRLERLAAVPIRFGEADARLGSLCRIREAPDHAAPPPGLQVALTDNADPATVQRLILEKLAEKGDGLGLTPP